MKQRKLTSEDTFNDYPIMTNKEKEQFCDTDILQEIQDQMEYAEISKTKTFCMRLDLRLPDALHHTDNRIFSRFQTLFMTNLSRKGLSPQYVAVREQSREKHQHYHELLLLDGQKTRCITNHLKTAERLWNKALGRSGENSGLVDDCTTFRSGVKGSNGVLLDPNDPEYEAKQNDVFYRASYLAKENTKQNTPKGQRELFSSRIPKDINSPRKRNEKKQVSNGV